MFVELMPMLAGRTVMITVAREDAKSIFCVIFVRFGVRTTMPLPRIDGVSRTRYDPPKGKAQPAQGLSLPSTVSLPTI